MTPGSQHPKDKRCFAYDRCKKVPDTFECSMCSNPVDCECRAGDYNPGMINDKEKIKILEANIRKKDNDIAVLTDMISSHPAASEQEIRADERDGVLDEIIKLSTMLDKDETEKWESFGRPKNDGYSNGSHSGYLHATRDIRSWIERIKWAERRQPPGGPE